MNPFLAMVLAATLWSTGGLFIKVLSLDPVSLAGWRSAVAAVALFGFARVHGVRVRLPREGLSWVAAVLYAAILMLFVGAARNTTAANAIFLQYTAPIYVLLLEPWLLKTRFRFADLGFVAIALFGMSLFFLDGLGGGQLLGNVLALGSGLCYALFTLATRSRRHDEHARWQSITVGNALLAVAALGWFLVTPASMTLPASGEEWASIVFLGVFQIGLAYALFAYAIARLSALETILLGMLEPVLNPVWVFLGTGERPGAMALVGAALIIASIALRTRLESSPAAS